MEKERKQKPRGIRNNNPLNINQLKFHVIKHNVEFVVSGNSPK